MDEVEILKKTIQIYLGSDLLAKLEKHGLDLLHPGGEKHQGIILHLRIDALSELVASTPIQEIFRFLSDYSRTTNSLVLQQNGYIHSIEPGNTICYFLTSRIEPALLLALRSIYAEFCRLIMKFGPAYSGLTFQAAFHTGEFLLLAFGSDERLHQNMIGNDVEVAKEFLRQLEGAGNGIFFTADAVQQFGTKSIEDVQNSPRLVMDPKYPRTYRIDLASSAGNPIRDAFLDN